MFMTGLDVSLIVVLILSGIWGYSRGFVHEILSVGTWVLAGFFTKLGAETLAPLIEKGFEVSETISLVLSYILIFVLGVFLASFIVKKIAARLHKTDFKSVDQTFGFIFGIVRGFIVMGGVYLFSLWLIPSETERPNWITQSRSRPVLRQSAGLIDTMFIPGKIKPLQEDIKNSEINEDVYRNLLKPAVETEEKDEKPQLNIGYSTDERSDLERQLRQLSEMEKLN